MVLYEARAHKNFSRSGDAEYCLFCREAGVLAATWRDYGASFLPLLPLLLAGRGFTIIRLKLVGNITNECLGSGLGS